MSVSAATRRVAALLMLCIVALPVRAETVYVTDRFEIGVHENTDIDSVIVATVPSGTALTVIGRDGEFVEITTPEGTRGWVDAGYVATSKPGTALIAEYDAKLKQAVRSLGDARAEVEVLRQRISELQRDAATAAQPSLAAAGIAKPVTLAESENAAKLEEAKRELETLSKENRKLEDQIAALEAARIESERLLADSEAMQPNPPEKSIWRGPVSDEAQSWTPWQWLLFGSILLLAFAAGGYAVDWESRRRHGGFRI